MRILFNAKLEAVIKWIEDNAISNALSRHDSIHVVMHGHAKRNGIMRRLNEQGIPYVMRSFPDRFELENGSEIIHNPTANEMNAMTRPVTVYLCDDIIGYRALAFGVGNGMSSLDIEDLFIACDGHGKCRRTFECGMPFRDFARTMMGKEQLTKNLPKSTIFC